MNEFVSALEFERAAALRDLVARLQQSQEQEAIVAEEGDCDIWAIGNRQDLFVVGLTRIRDGRHLGTWTWFPSGDAPMDGPSVLSAFVSQFYEEAIPPKVLVDRSFPDLAVLQTVLEKRSGHPVRLIEPRGHTEKLWLEMTEQNVKLAMDRRLASHALLRERFDALQNRLGWPDPVGRIVCFDVSHTQGVETVASAVVFEPEGPVKSAYRRFNLKLEQGGDDYAGLDQALKRYFSRILRESAPRPDLLLIDGGIGQL
ncbi:excinuclease ABC, C subunit, partial [mine drainage metagenome]